MGYCYARVGRGVPQSSTDAAGRDNLWISHMAGAARAGLAVGGYWRFFPSVDFERQVSLFATGLTVGGRLPLPPWVDLEDAGGLQPGPLTDWAIDCLEQVQALTGTRPLLYTNRWFLANALEPARLTGWDLALAAYTDDPAWPDPRAVFWQYAQNVTVPWASGPVDLQRHRGALI